MKETKLAQAGVLACLLWFAPRIGHAAELIPANGAAGVCPDTQLRLTFAAAPFRGSSGKIQIFDAAGQSLVESIAAADQQKSKTIGSVPGLHYLPVLLDGNQAITTLEKPLAYRHSYSIMVDPGFFQGDPGITDKTAWHFTTKDAPPAAGGRAAEAHRRRRWLGRLCHDPRSSCSTPSCCGTAPTPPQWSRRSARCARPPPPPAQRPPRPRRNRPPTDGGGSGSEATYHFSRIPSVSGFNSPLICTRIFGMS